MQLSENRSNQNKTFGHRELDQPQGLQKITVGKVSGEYYKSLVGGQIA